jgi:hypothetical protein
VFKVIFKVIGIILSFVVVAAIILAGIALGTIAFTGATSSRMLLTPWYFVKIDKGQEPSSAFLSQMQKDGWAVSSQDTESIVLTREGKTEEVKVGDIVPAIVDDKLFIFESCGSK